MFPSCRNRIAACIPVVLGLALTVSGQTFRDLNKNGRLDTYEDPKQPIKKRIDDLLSQLTLEEKVGLMFCPIVGVNADGSLVEDQSHYSQIGTPEAITADCPPLGKVHAPAR